MGERVKLPALHLLMNIQLFSRRHPLSCQQRQILFDCFTNDLMQVTGRCVIDVGDERFSHTWLPELFKMLCNVLLGYLTIRHALEKIRRGEVGPNDAEMEVGPLARERDMMDVEQRLGVLA